MSHGVSRAPDAERKWPGSLSHASEGGHGDDRVAPPAAESASEDSPSLLDVNAHPPPRACWPRPKPCGGQALSRFSLISRSHRSCLLRLVRAFGVWGGSKLCRQLCSFPVTKSFGQREGVHSGARLLSPSCQPLPSPPPSSKPPPPVYLVLCRAGKFSFPRPPNTSVPPLHPTGDFPRPGEGIWILDGPQYPPPPRPGTRRPLLVPGLLHRERL